MMELLALALLTLVAIIGGMALGVDSRDESDDPRRSVYPVGITS